MDGWVPVFPWVELDKATWAYALLPPVWQKVIIAVIHDCGDGDGLCATVRTGWWCFDDKTGDPKWVCDQGYTPDIVFAWMPLPDFPEWYTDAEEEDDDES